MIREVLYFTEGETESVSISKKAKGSVYNEIVRDYEQSFFQDHEKFL